MFRPIIFRKIDIWLTNDLDDQKCVFLGDFWKYFIVCRPLLINLLSCHTLGIYCFVAFFTRYSDMYNKLSTFFPLNLVFGRQVTWVTTKSDFFVIFEISITHFDMKIIFVPHMGVFLKVKLDFDRTWTWQNITLYADSRNSFVYL